MAALTKDRKTAEREGRGFGVPLLADAKSYKGGIAVLDADGWGKPGATATGLLAAGRFEEQVDNTGGANGALTVEVKAGVFQWANSAGADEITRAEIGDDCYIVDDQTVAKTDGTSTRSKAGKIADVDTDGVWVRIAPYA